MSVFGISRIHCNLSVLHYTNIFLSTGVEAFWEETKF